MPSRLNAHLIKKLLAKPGFTGMDALAKRIQRRANKEGITTEAALIVISREAGLSVTRELAKAPHQVRTEVQGVSQRGPVSRSVGVTRRKIEKTINLRIGPDILSDPLLSPSVIQDAQNMSTRVYPLLYLFENSIREFIRRVMTKDFTDQWWGAVMSKSRKLSEVRDKVADRMTKEKQFTYHGKRGAHPIFYADFDDLAIVMRSNAANFRKFFPQHSQGAEWLASRMDEIGPSRNVTAHHNPLSTHDFERLRVNVRDWEKHLASIKDQL